MVSKAFYGDRNHLGAGVICPGAADFLGLEGVVLGAVAVDHFDIAAPLFGPQAVGRNLAGTQQAEHGQGF